MNERAEMQPSLDKDTQIEDLAKRVRELEEALVKIKSLLSFANQDAVSRAAAQSNLNAAWWQAAATLSGKDTA